jgi:hypothetical protein
VPAIALSLSEQAAFTVQLVHVDPAAASTLSVRSAVPIRSSPSMHRSANILSGAAFRKFHPFFLAKPLIYKEGRGLRKQIAAFEDRACFLRRPWC